MVNAKNTGQWLLVKLNNERFSFIEILVNFFSQVVAVGVDEGQGFDEFAFL